MVLYKSLFAFTFFALTFSHSAAHAVTFDLMSTVQDCNHEGHRETWCTSADIDASMEKSGIVRRIVEQLDRALINPKKSRVLAAEFSFSNRDVQSKLCDLGKAGVAITIYLDYSQMPKIDLGECQRSVKKPNYTIEPLGGFTAFPEWRLHHNKTVLVDAGDGSPFDIDFSSGNLSVFGTSLHLENWVMMTAPPESNLARSTLCLFEGLAAADRLSEELAVYPGLDFSKDPQIMDRYMGTINSCYKKNKVIPMHRTEEALAKDGIAPIYTPNNGRLGPKTLLAEIKKVTELGKGAYIYIAMENFTQSNIARALKAAVDSGVDVRLIMNSGTITGDTGVSSNISFYDKTLRDSGIKIRFIETNPTAGGNGQQMHNKFTILNGERVFSGAGHFTRAGLETNYETLYLTADNGLNIEYLIYFKKLWDASVDERAMRAGTVNEATPPETLDSRALSLIGE